jgi:hypothetical protein
VPPCNVVTAEYIGYYGIGIRMPSSFLVSIPAKIKKVASLDPLVIYIESGLALTSSLFSIN